MAKKKSRRMSGGAIALVIVMVALLGTGVFFVSQQTGFDGEGNVCYDNLGELPVECVGADIIADTQGVSSCRTITCGDRTVQACPKPDEPPHSGFEMYHKAGSTSIDICLDGKCIGQSGFLKANVNFCSAPADDGGDEPGDDTTVCTTDVMTCEDGTDVSRDPDNGCEFFACPAPSDEGTDEPGDDAGDDVSEGMSFKTKLLIGLLAGVIVAAIGFIIYVARK